jgi:MSHA biogenesis protein MshM
MYLNHFGMSERPFSITPDTQFFINSTAHQEALNTLLFALGDGQGFIKIVGEVGTGKTLLCRILMATLDKSEFVTAYIPNPELTPIELKGFVAQELGAEIKAEMPMYEMVASIYRKLMHYARQGKKVVLIIDEAQAMPRATMEALRLLSNLETEKRKLLHVVLVGQPELETLLNRDDLRQLKQRIVFSEKLRPLDNQEVYAYVRHRLATSACHDQRLFATSALWLLSQASGGVPRLINILAHKALLAAYATKEQEVKFVHMVKAVQDTPESTSWGRFCCHFTHFNVPFWMAKSLEAIR